ASPISTPATVWSGAGWAVPVVTESLDILNRPRRLVWTGVDRPSRTAYGPRPRGAVSHPTRGAHAARAGDLPPWSVWSPLRICPRRRMSWWWDAARPEPPPRRGWPVPDARSRWSTRPRSRATRLAATGCPRERGGSAAARGWVSWGWDPARPEPPPRGGWPVPEARSRWSTRPRSRATRLAATG